MCLYPYMLVYDLVCECPVCPLLLFLTLAKLTWKCGNPCFNSELICCLARCPGLCVNQPLCRCDCKSYFNSNTIA